jgi:hypothetical protein
MRESMRDVVGVHEGRCLIVYQNAFTPALDRIALYLIPLQLAVFAHVPEVFGTRQGRNTLFTAVVLLYYAAVLFV